MEELRQRNTFNNNNNNNNNDDDNVNPFAPAEEFQEQQQQRYTPQLPLTRFQTLLKQADRSWRDLQSRYTFLEGGTINNGIDKRIPLMLHPWIVRYKYYKMPIYVTIFFMILILTAYSVRHAYVQRSLQLHIRENEMLDWEGNRFENGFDLKSLETSTPYQYTLTKSDFDLWIINEQKKEQHHQQEVVTVTEEDIIITATEEEEDEKKKKFINRFTDKEFENGYFESKVFLGATLLKSASETPSPHNISMLNVNEALKDRCSNPEKCDCISLLQLGIPRNVILIFDHEQKEYNILYDPEIAGQSATRTTFKYYMNEEQEIHDKHKEIVAQSKGKRVTVITDVNNAKKKAAAATSATAVNSAMYFRMNVPTSILVQYKKTENRGKVSREQFSGGASACICNILKIEADYSSYLKEIEETEEIKF